MVLALLLALCSALGEPFRAPAALAMPAFAHPPCIPVCRRAVAPVCAPPAVRPAGLVWGRVCARTAARHAAAGRPHRECRDGGSPANGVALVGSAGTRAGYQIVKTLTLPAELPVSARDAARLERAASVQAHERASARPAAGTGEGGGMSAATALAECFKEEFPTISSARKAIRRGEVLSAASNMELSSTSVLRGGDVVHVQACAAPGLYPRGKAPFEVTVLFEDDHLAAVVKPPGVLTHRQIEKGSKKSQGGTMVSALAFALHPTTLLRDAMERPQPLHRLDMGTGGVLLAGKTLPASQELYRQFAAREVAKEYEALACGLLTGKVSRGGRLGEVHFRCVRQCVRACASACVLRTRACLLSHVFPDPIRKLMAPLV